MGKKYIIELKDNTAWLQWVNVVDDGQVRFDFKYPEDLTPYTEPDLEQVRKEAFEKGYSTAVAEQECAVRGAAEKGYQKGYETGYKDGYHEPGKNQQEAYQRGLNDAWETARKIASDNAGRNYSIFGQHFTTEILNTHSASEAIEKIRAYEQEKEKFHVGDEFEIESGKRFVILKMDGVEIDRYIDEEGKTYCMYQKYKVMRKTGRHFPEIAEVMQRMKESE